MKHHILVLLAGLMLAAGPVLAQETAEAPAQEPAAAAVAVSVAAPPGAPAAPQVAQWQVMPVESTLSFSGKQMETAFSGVFKTFTAEISFDPENLPLSKAVVLIDLASVESKDAERDSNLKGHEFFNTEKFPQARFETTTISKLNDGSYMAEGTLTIGEIAAPVQLPFTLDIATDAKGARTAMMKGTTTINRATWKVGTGDWADPSVIANDVRIDVILAAVNDPSQRPADSQPPAPQ